ncbi:MAG: diphthine synthase [Candidatus Nanoarchaeia archaeon]
MLVIIGMGLRKDDLSVRALSLLKRADKIYLESYTSIVDGATEFLKEQTNKQIILADRTMVESNPVFIEEAKNQLIALVILGDVFAATTHSDLFLRAKKEQIEVEICHASSILTAVADTGLSLYKFGKTGSIPFPDERWLNETPYNVLEENKDSHTLFLLDLNLKEKKFMKGTEAIEILLAIEKEKKKGLFKENKLVILCAGLTTEKQEMYYGEASKVKEVKCDTLPQCLIVPTKLHFMEEEMLTVVAEKVL